jgi:predicted lipid-binding transport protein (Tim44 family)
LDILIYAVIAGVLIYRLYTILGQRDGGNRPRNAPFVMRNPPNPADKKGKEDLLALPLAQPKPATPKQDNVVQMQPPSFAVEPAAASLAGAIFAIQKADPSFDERSFLKGARVAFEMIVRAFAAGDRTALKNLLTPPLYTAFEAAISTRELKGERWEMKIMTIKDMDLLTATMDGSVALLTTQCMSEQSKHIYDKEGALQQDASSAVESLTDIWTWRRDTKSTNPNWQLVETKSV